jgi:hypothetical protein
VSFDAGEFCCTFIGLVNPGKRNKTAPMSFTELKEKVVDLSVEERFKLSAFLSDLEQEKQMEFRSEVDRRMKKMDGGDKISMEDFEKRDQTLRENGH